MDESGLPCVLRHDVPDHSLAQRFRGLFGILSATHAPKQRALRYPGRDRPGVDRHFHKWRDGHCPDPLSLAHQVDEYPAAVALLDVLRLERRELAPARAGLAEAL